MHTNACAALRYHLGQPLQWDTAHTLEEWSYFRISLQKVCIHVAELSRTRYIHRKYPLLLMLWILIIPLDYTVIRHFFQLLQEFFLRIFWAESLHISKCSWMTLLHLDTDLALLICNKIVKSPVLRAFCCDIFLAKLYLCTVGNSLCKLCKWLTERLIL